MRGELYSVNGMRLKWYGKRFARCCQHAVCGKLAQGKTEWCKSHGGDALHDRGLPARRARRLGPLRRSRRRQALSRCSFKRCSFMDCPVLQ